MPGILEAVDAAARYRSHYDRVMGGRADGGADGKWFDTTRAAAFERFSELGFPGTRDEAWRHTNVAPIAAQGFAPADGDAAVAPDAMKPLVLPDGGGARLVFVNGRLSRALSSTGSVGGVRMCGLAEAMGDADGVAARHLARHASFDAHAFTALNTALLVDGALVHIPAGAVVDGAIELVFISTSSAPATVSHPRSLIIAERNCQATIVETYAGVGAGVYFTNAVTEVVAGDGAVVDHYKVGREGERAYHVGTLQIHQERGSQVSSHALTFGGRLVRNDINTVMSGEGCCCTLRGLYVIGGEQHVDNHLVVDHARAHCDSREFFKGILDGGATGVFTGRIVVRDGAQKTDAKQTNNSLILSDRARVESQPQLEIFADDVKCTHGATIGRVDDEAVFYLRSRGLGDVLARSMLVHAFAGESVAEIKVEALRRRLESLVLTRLPQGGLLQGAL